MFFIHNVFLAVAAVVAGGIVTAEDVAAEADIYPPMTAGRIIRAVEATITDARTTVEVMAAVAAEVVMEEVAAVMTVEDPQRARTGLHLLDVMNALRWNSSVLDTGQAASTLIATKISPLKPQATMSPRESTPFLMLK